MQAKIEYADGWIRWVPDLREFIAERRGKPVDLDATGEELAEQVCRNDSKVVKVTATDEWGEYGYTAQPDHAGFGDFGLE